ncbi:aminotransferase class V-fold PLP-dependent enzyme, partial [Clostridium sp. HCS.1]|uniref:aminotransferase class V-fold PLP-dependent enzyme n=1 Tax=Clostridium sp. HCS.1 TaxID=3238594 RepID=UPI003A0FB8D1
YEKNKSLRNLLVSELQNINNVILNEDFSNENNTSCVSFNAKNIDTAELSFILDSDFGIKNRSGLNCAPLAHKTIGSFPTGTVRLSLSYFNSEEDIKYS